MPSKSKKQHNLMAAVANNPEFAKRVGIPQSVGEDYVESDIGRKFKGGGPMPMRKRKKKVNKNLRDEEARVIARQDDAMDEMRRLRRKAADEEMGMACGGKVHMAKGGKVRGCGIARKGLTRGTMR